MADVVAKTESVLVDVKDIATNVLHDVEGLGEKVVDAIENEFSGGDAKAAAPDAPAAPAAGSLESVLNAVASVMTVGGRTPKAWDKLTKFAISSTGSTDADTVLARAKDLVALSGTKTDVWEDAVEFAKAIA